MGFAEAVRSVFRKYAVFGGRARRAEFWWFRLFSLICSGLTLLLDTVLLGRSLDETGPFSALLALALLVPSLAVTWRRLHDTDRSGWWALIALVPFVGVIVLIVFAVQDSRPGTNRFGPSPKGGVSVTPGYSTGYGPGYGQP